MIVRGKRDKNQKERTKLKTEKRNISFFRRQRLQRKQFKKYLRKTIPNKIAFFSQNRQQKELSFMFQKLVLVLT